MSKSLRMEPPRYRIAPDGKSITCLICGETSFLSCDVKLRYCERCNVFHELRLPALVAPPVAGAVKEKAEG